LGDEVNGDRSSAQRPDPFSSTRASPSVNHKCLLDPSSPMRRIGQYHEPAIPPFSAPLANGTSALGFRPAIPSILK